MNPLTVKGHPIACSLNLNLNSYDSLSQQLTLAYQLEYPEWSTHTNQRIAWGFQNVGSSTTPNLCVFKDPLVVFASLRLFFGCQFRQFQDLSNLIKHSRKHVIVMISHVPNVSKIVSTGRNVKSTHLFRTLAGQLESDLETCQIKQGFDTHKIGCCQHIENHVAIDVVVCDEILIPLLINDLYIPVTRTPPAHKTCQFICDSQNKTRCKILKLSCSPHWTWNHPTVLGPPSSSPQHNAS